MIDIKTNKKIVKVYNISDLHADTPENKSWVENHCIRTRKCTKKFTFPLQNSLNSQSNTEFNPNSVSDSPSALTSPFNSSNIDDDLEDEEDIFKVMILPGDVASSLKVILEIWSILVPQYDAVCYVPGNHDLWLHNSNLPYISKLKQGTKLNIENFSNFNFSPNLSTYNSNNSTPLNSSNKSSTNNVFNFLEEDTCKDSLEKFNYLLKLAKDYGVYVDPIRIIFDYDQHYNETNLNLKRNINNKASDIPKLITSNLNHFSSLTPKNKSSTSFLKHFSSFSAKNSKDNSYYSFNDNATEEELFNDIYRDPNTNNIQKNDMDYDFIRYEPNDVDVDSDTNSVDDVSRSRSNSSTSSFSSTPMASSIGPIYFPSNSKNHLKTINDSSPTIEYQNLTFPPSHEHYLLIIPLFSWYHESWDVEPDLTHQSITEMESIFPFHHSWTDFSKCIWPEEITKKKLTPEILNNFSSLAEFNNNLNKTDIVPHYFSQLNKSTIEEYQQHFRLKGSKDNTTVITFSHFVPNSNLYPEKKFLLQPLLSKVVGSKYLQEEIKLISPNLHIFGHTHVPIDLTLDGIRYLQWPLGYKRERVKDLQKNKEHIDAPKIGVEITNKNFQSLNSTYLCSCVYDNPPLCIFDSSISYENSQCICSCHNKETIIATPKNEKADISNSNLSSASTTPSISPTSSPLGGSTINSIGPCSCNCNGFNNKGSWGIPIDLLSRSTFFSNYYMNETRINDPLSEPHPSYIEKRNHYLSHPLLPNSTSNSNIAVPGTSNSTTPSLASSSSSSNYSSNLSISIPSNNPSAPNSISKINSFKLSAPPTYSPYNAATTTTNTTTSNSSNYTPLSPGPFSSRINTSLDSPSPGFTPRIHRLGTTSSTPINSSSTNTPTLTPKRSFCPTNTSGFNISNKPLIRTSASTYNIKSLSSSSSTPSSFKQTSSFDNNSCISKSSDSLKKN